MNSVNWEMRGFMITPAIRHLGAQLDIVYVLRQVSRMPRPDRDHGAADDGRHQTTAPRRRRPRDGHEFRHDNGFGTRVTLPPGGTAGGRGPNGRWRHRQSLDRLDSRTSGEMNLPSGQWSQAATS